MDNYTDELYHFGIKGQKWGIRRYQNFDGSYTKAGLERYNKSSKKYEAAKNAYADAKQKRKAGLASKYEVNLAKGNMKRAKARMNKDYKHLKQDKLADQGKALYGQGKRITNNTLTTVRIAYAGTLISVGAGYARRAGLINAKTARASQAASLGLIAASGMKSLLDQIPNNKLRAYYAHTSNY